MYQPTREPEQVVKLGGRRVQRGGSEISARQRRQPTRSEQPALVVEDLELVEHRVHDERAVGAHPCGINPRGAGQEGVRVSRGRYRRVDRQTEDNGGGDEGRMQ